MKVLVKNTHNLNVGISVDGIIIWNGEEALVEENKISKNMLDKKMLTKVDETVAELSNVDSVIELLRDDPSLLGEDDFTASGVPLIGSLEELSGFDFNSTERDQIWEAVSGLYDENE